MYYEWTLVVLCFVLVVLINHHVFVFRPIFVCYLVSFLRVIFAVSSSIKPSLNHHHQRHHRLMSTPPYRHNALRDLVGNLLSEVCHNVAIEPQLAPLSGEVFTRPAV